MLLARLLLIFIARSAGLNITALTCDDFSGFLDMHATQVSNRARNETSRARPQLLAFIHLVGTLSNLRRDCVTESFRFISMLLIRDSLPLLKNEASGDLFVPVFERFAENLKRLPRNEPVIPYYSHENDGRLTTLEAMRIRTFNEQKLSPVCLLQFALNNLFAPGDVVLDIGSGPGAADSIWLNKTGIVRSYAIDSFPETSFVTDGQVSEVDITDTTALSEFISSTNREIDWVWFVRSSPGSVTLPYRMIVMSRDSQADNRGNHSETEKARAACRESLGIEAEFISVLNPTS